MSNNRETHKSKVVEIDGELFLPLPDFALKRLDLKVGDEVEFCHSVDRNGILLTRPESDFDKIMKIANKIMDEERPVLAELAKS